MNIVIVDDERDVKALFEQRFRREVRQGLLQLHFDFSAGTLPRAMEERGRQGVIVDVARAAARARVR